MILSILPIPLALGCIIFLFFNEIWKGISLEQCIKLFICFIFSIVIIAVIITTLSLEIYQLATIWKEYEVVNVLDPSIRSSSFIAIELLWSFICIGLLFLLWKFVYFHQIISGVGSVKQRIKLHFAQLKKEEG